MKEDLAITFFKSRWCLCFFDPVFCFHIKNFCIMPNLLVEVEKQTGTVFNICFGNIETFVGDRYVLAFCQIILNSLSSSSQLRDTFNSSEKRLCGIGKCHGFTSHENNSITRKVDLSFFAQDSTFWERKITKELVYISYSLSTEESFLSIDQ